MLSHSLSHTHKYERNIFYYGLISVAVDQEGGGNYSGYILFYERRDEK